jgi:hypothetical protein
MKKNGQPAKKKRGSRSAKGAFVLGSDRFAKISAVEGMTLTTGMKVRMKEFDRERTPADERRRTIIRSHSKG